MKMTDYVNPDGLVYTPTNMKFESIESNEVFYEKMTAMVTQSQMIVFTHE